MKQTRIVLTFFNVHISRILLGAAVFLVICGICISSSSAESTAFTLTATANGQGSIYPSGTFDANEGSSRSFVFNADENNHMVDVVIDGVSIGPVDAFSFENINAPHTIEAVFESDAAVLATASEKTDGDS